MAGLPKALHSEAWHDFWIFLVVVQAAELGVEESFDGQNTDGSNA